MRPRGVAPHVVQYCSVSQATLQTDRIRLIPLGDEHLELEVELDSDPEVMRYLSGDGRTRAQVEKAHGLRLATAEPVAGLGFWVGFVEDEFVGWWLLQPAGWGEETLLPGQVELGYRLLRRHWGKGLASEGAREMVRHSFQDLDIVFVGPGDGYQDKLALKLLTDLFYAHSSYLLPTVYLCSHLVSSAG